MVFPKIKFKGEFSMNIIECKNLTKEYLSGENTVMALNDVSLEFEKGEFCAITGPSGSGKSTFLHVLSSLENATSGEVIYNNESLKKYNDNQLSILRRRRFGFVFQAYNLVEELTGYENILLPIMLDKKKPDEEYLKKSLTFSALKTDFLIYHLLFQAVSNRELLLQEHLQINHQSFLRMSPRVTWTAKVVARCSHFLNM